MQKSEFIAKIKNLAKTIYAEKSNPLADADEIRDQVTKFPVVDKFPPLKKVMEDLFDFQYEPFVEDVEWVAPRPTTFRIKLVNGADFFLIYEGEDGGKGLFIQQASEAIARLLRYKFADTGKTDEEDVDAGLDAELGDDLASEDSATEPAEDDTGLPASIDDL